jgi:hypothetical protein
MVVRNRARRHGDSSTEEERRTWEGVGALFIAAEGGRHAVGKVAGDGGRIE